PPQMVAELKKAIETNFILVSADANQDEALRKLQNGEVDVVELFPPDVSQVILRVPLGQQSPVVFRYSEVNPQNESWVKYLRVAPISINTILVGKYLAYILYVGIIAALLVGALVLMRTPFLGSPLYFAALALLVIVSSLGYGFLISAVSRSDSQAVQLSMLVL